MNELEKSKLPLIFHFLKKKEITAHTDAIVQQQNHVINIPFYQTPFFKPDIFYKPISKIFQFNYDSINPETETF